MPDMASVCTKSKSSFLGSLWQLSHASEVSMCPSGFSVSDAIVFPDSTVHEKTTKTKRDKKGVELQTTKRFKYLDFPLTGLIIILQSPWIRAMVVH